MANYEIESGSNKFLRITKIGIEIDYTILCNLSMNNTVFQNLISENPFHF